MIEETIFHVLLCSVICVIIHFFFHKRVDDKSHHHKLELTPEQREDLYKEFVVRFWASLSPPTKNGRAWDMKAQEFIGPAAPKTSIEGQILEFAMNKNQEIKDKKDLMEFAFKSVDKLLHRGSENKNDK